MKVEKTFCTTREAATMLGVSVGTAQLWVENGLLAAWKTPGGHRRVLRDSVDQLLHIKSHSPGSFEAATPRLKILVIEDDLSLLRSYQTMLARWPMAPQVFAVANGIEALLTIEREHPALLILDLNLAGTDCFQMLKILKSKPGLAAMTIVVVTQLSKAEIAQRGGIPDGIQVLPKPVPFATLLSIATSVVQGRQRRRRTGDVS